MVFLLTYALEGMLTINGRIRMNYKLYIIALAFCSMASCKQQKNEEPIQDSMSIISKATEEAGGLENWTKLNEVKFGLNKISFEKGASSEINEIHMKSHSVPNNPLYDKIENIPPVAEIIKRTKCKHFDKTFKLILYSLLLQRRRKRTVDS